MEKLDKLYQWLSGEGVYLFDRQLPFSNEDTKALTIKLKETGACGVFLDKGRMQSRAEETSTVAHEAGHYATGTTHSLCSPFDLIEKHEYKADKWAVTRLVTHAALDKAVKSGIKEAWSLAEYFGVTEDFMKKAICFYKYGNLNPELYL